jgi:hypothetical protein
MFTQDSTFGIYVFQGLNGETEHQAFSGCCGYAESIAVDTNDYAQLAFWSNASAFPNLFVYEGLDSTGGQAGPGRAFGQPQTAPHSDHVPLVADGRAVTRPRRASPSTRSRAATSCGHRSSPAGRSRAPTRTWT